FLSPCRSMQTQSPAGNKYTSSGVHMAGWVPIEKDLLSDPRFIRLAHAVHDCSHAEPDDVTQVRFTCNACAYRVLGMLAGLWLYADTHIQPDDTLALSHGELDSMLGFEGFSDILADASRGQWLDFDPKGDTVKLPGYQVHNGMEAKARYQTQRRV